MAKTYRVFVESIGTAGSHLYVWVVPPTGKPYALNVENKKITRSAFSEAQLERVFREV